MNQLYYQGQSFLLCSKFAINCLHDAIVWMEKYSQVETKGSPCSGSRIQIPSVRKYAKFWSILLGYQLNKNQRPGAMWTLVACSPQPCTACYIVYCVCGREVVPGQSKRGQLYRAPKENQKIKRGSLCGLFLTERKEYNVYRFPCAFHVCVCFLPLF